MFWQEVPSSIAGGPFRTGPGSSGSASGLCCRCDSSHVVHIRVFVAFPMHIERECVVGVENEIGGAVTSEVQSSYCILSSPALSTKPAIASLNWAFSRTWRPMVRTLIRPTLMLSPFLSAIPCHCYCRLFRYEVTTRH